MAFKTKYFLYFRGSLIKHVHFYENIRDISIKNGIPMNLITFLEPHRYYRERHLIRGYRKKGIKIYPALGANFIGVIYFFFIAFFSRQTVIHLKKRNPVYFILLKRLIRKKIILITDLEGDLISEESYLKKIINASESESLQRLIIRERKNLKLYDCVFVQNASFQELLEFRHPHLRGKFFKSHLMSFQKGNLFFNEQLRSEYRAKLGWEKNQIFVYIGDINYPWQNISKTIRLYKKIKEEGYSQAKLLLLIKESSHDLARKFIHFHELNNDDFFLTEVNYSEMNGFLNAADVGVVLRDFHIMNKVVTSGKLLDYIGSGLPVITTSVFGSISEELRKKNYGLILDSLKIEDSIHHKDIQKIINLSSRSRSNLSRWANKFYSLDNTMKKYLEYLKTQNK